MEKEIEKALENLVRVGTVTDVDATRLRVRVKFQDLNMSSGWLPVLQHSGAGLSIPSDGAHSHTVSSETTSTDGAHDHAGSALGAWLPQVNDTVLTLYLPVFSGDGFVLGQLT